MLVIFYVCYTHVICTNVHNIFYSSDVDCRVNIRPTRTGEVFLLRVDDSGRDWRAASDSPGPVAPSNLHTEGGLINL